MTNTNKLDCSSVNTVPQDADWEALAGEDFDGWRATVACECSGCNRIVVAPSMGEMHCNEADHEITVTNEDGEEEEVTNECQETIYNEGPQIGCFYPIRIDDSEEAARLIAHLPLCVIDFEDGRTALALTGGGMDLSWEICEAFMLLGSLPPLHFCELPLMGNRGTSARDQEIVAACAQSCKVAADWAKNKGEHLARLVATTKAKKAKK